MHFFEVLSMLFDRFTTWRVVDRSEVAKGGREFTGEDEGGIL
jgi:hypothetical protein